MIYYGILADSIKLGRVDLNSCVSVKMALKSFLLISCVFVKALKSIR
jgi:hypothetical protein